MESGDLQTAVIQTSQRADVRAAVAELYADLEKEVARRRPLCVISGRCCQFEEYGHRLFVTTMELASFAADLRDHPPQPRTEPGDGRGCPFQIAKLCGVHAIRPMGCRLFFCDTTATDWQREQYEAFHSRLKRLHESLDVPYAYLEWRSALNLLGFK